MRPAARVAMIRANAVKDITGIVTYPNMTKNTLAHDSPPAGHGMKALPPSWTYQLYAATADPHRAANKAMPSMRLLPRIHA